jgi:hypothetical protein
MRSAYRWNRPATPVALNRSVSKLKEQFRMKRQFLAATMVALCADGALAGPQGSPSASIPSVTVIGHRPGAEDDPDRGWGSPGDGYPVNRIVRLGSKPTWANVDYGQNVEFIASNRDGSQRTFKWRFNGWPDKNMIRLSSVAPPDFFDHEVRIYIGPDPRYVGGG